ncbi:Carboxylesterase family-domain-containing protein [Thelonectria olida]|uniref:Carboxylic ester hydrolase n=1 Tax=Thelonectria olida TaxID=1576542 RepID=A0A9P8W4V4_9HYPO|nr:Carboxylesterase family-domain-containing protein [Thelonectria olida]
MGSSLRAVFVAVLATLANEHDSNKHNKLHVLSPNFSVQGSYASNISTLVRRFLGIPYAEPPLSEHHFKPLKTKIPYQNTLNATSFGPVCMQYDTGAPSVFSEYLPGQRVTTGMSEDCLTLNIWTPQERDIGRELFPIMIWIPGGALVSGGSSVPNTNGARFVQAQKMLMVTINYRVNIFGFLGAAGLDGRHVNPGLLDQRKAVEWLYDNIAYFGGDPTKVTLFGQSAGGSILDICLARRSSRPRFHRHVWLDISCGGLAKDDELRRMQTANSTEIIEVYSKYNASENGGASLAFGAMADDETIFANRTEKRDRGLVSRLVS